MRTIRTFAATCLTLVVTTTASLPAQSDVDVAMTFFSVGGAYCFRVSPEGVNLAEEIEWTVMVLTSASSRDDTFKIRSVERGQARLNDSGLATAGRAVTGVWRLDRYKTEFFERFAAGIDERIVRARVVKVALPGLAQMTPAARTERYLRFADRGSEVSFEDVPDLTADAFRQYAGYFAD